MVDIGKGVKINVREVVSPPVLRSIEQVSLGCHFVGAAAVHVDTGDVKTLEQAVLRRVCRKMPARDPEFLGKFLTHVKKAIQYYNLQPIEADYPFLFEEWLAGTNYDEKRKEELRKIHLDVVDLLERNDDGELTHFKVKLFMKDESYMEFKNGRGIYARDDVAKVFFGPYIKQMENAIYYDPATGSGVKHFIKHVPVDKRADYIMETVFVEGFDSVCTDYSGLEAHYDGDLLESCTFPLYDHMLGSNPHGRVALGIMREVFKGVNKIQNKFLSVKILARLMSGEMDTSLRNGWFNLMMATYFLMDVYGISFEQARLIIEGDDGLVMIPKGAAVPDEKYFAAKGCCIKINVVEDISRASFCGLVFDPEERNIITDPFKVLMNFGYTSKRYACASDKKLKALLRSKAMSMLVQYHGCPILGVLAEKMLDLTRSFDVRHVINSTTDQWQRQKLQYASKSYKRFLGKQIGSRTRYLFEELYGIPPEVQVNIEAHIKEMSDIQPLFFPELIPECGQDAREYFEKFQHVYNIADGRFVLQPDMAVGA